MSNRTCGSCTLCCKLMPVVENADLTLWDMVGEMIGSGLLTMKEAATTIRDFNKPAGEKCPHQCSKGCRVYNQRPLACRFWSCSWLSEQEGTGKLGRPDRTHYVINPVPDYVDSTDERGSFKTPVIEVWCDPKYPDAWRDPNLLAYLEEQASKHGFAALIRYNSHDAIFVAAPCLSADRRWIIKQSGMKTGPAHSWEQKLEALGDMKVTIERI